jgi:hypothetical protein
MASVLDEAVDPGERVFGDDKFVYRRLQEVTPIEGDVVVYNLETTGSHSYIANGLSVHNCQYCGTRKEMTQLNYDHVHPRVRGGRTVWENIVTSCYPCNDRKGHRTLEQAGMKLLRKPFRPKTLPMSFLQIDRKTIPEVWSPYCQAQGVEEDRKDVFLMTGTA